MTRKYARVSLSDVLAMVREAFSRATPGVEPITYDAERMRRNNERAERATVVYGPSHPKYQRDDSPSLGMPMRTINGRTYRPRVNEPRSATTAHDCLRRAS